MANDNATAKRTEESKPVVRVKYLEDRKPKVFVQGKPEVFEVFTSETNSRLYGALLRMDTYAIFIGTEQAQNELGKLKINTAMQLFQAKDLREAAETFAELADILEGKVR